MVRIGLLSDTHSYLHPGLIPMLAQCDEIWHAGDVGNRKVLDQLHALDKTMRVVYGNIDGKDIRIDAPQHLIFQLEGKKVLMTHIGGYPGRYPAAIKKMLIAEKPDLFICGHSHILKVIYDKQLNLLHINPGAAGKEGIQKVSTMIKFTIHGNQIKDMAIIEL